MTTATAQRIEMFEDATVIDEQPQQAQAVAVRASNAVTAAPAANDSQTLLSIITRVAADPTVDIEKVERLWAMHRDMKGRDNEAAFNDAMNKAQSEMGRVSADASNQQTRSVYATYGKLDAKVRPIYTRHGFSLSFDTGDGAPEGCLRVLAYVSHSAGHTRTYRADMPADGKGAKGGDVMTKTHASGSAMSYGMRYLLKLIFNIAVGEEDDDGNAAGGEQGDGYARGYTQPPATYPDADFKKNLPAWREAILAGKTTAAAVIAKVQTKAPLTKQQQAQIHGQ